MPVHHWVKGPTSISHLPASGELTICTHPKHGQAGRQVDCRLPDTCWETVRDATVSNRSKSMRPQERPAITQCGARLTAVRSPCERYSLRLDAGLSDDNAPAVAFLVHKRSEIGGRAAADIGPLVDEPFTDVGYPQNFDELAFEAAHHGRRRGSRNHYSLPQRYVHAVVAELCKGGHVRQQAVALADANFLYEAAIQLWIPKVAPPIPGGVRAP